MTYEVIGLLLFMLVHEDRRVKAAAPAAAAAVEASTERETKSAEPDREGNVRGRG